jgi:hypothetical protein
VGETVSTTSTLLPQELHTRAMFFAPARAVTSVFDFALPAISHTPFKFF